MTDVNEDVFKREKLAVEFCKTYGYEEGSREWEIATNAFCVGYYLGKRENHHITGETKGE